MATAGLYDIQSRNSAMRTGHDGGWLYLTVAGLIGGSYVFSEVIVDLSSSATLK